MHEPARLLARDPTPAGQRDAAVQRHSNLVGHERAAERLPRAPCLVLTECGWIVEQLDVDPGRAQLLDPSRRDGIRIERADHDARDTGGDHGVRARRRPPVVRARLERHVERRAARAIARLCECPRLGVLDGRELVPALADDLIAVDDDGADERMVLDLAAAALRELQGPLEMTHASACTKRRYERGRSSRWKIALPATISVAPAS